MQNQAKEIINRARPLIHLSSAELGAMIMQAEFMAQSVQETMDPENMSAKIVILASHKLICDSQEELAQRN